MLISDGGLTDVLSEYVYSIFNSKNFVLSRRIAVSYGQSSNERVLSSYCTFASDVFTPDTIEKIGDIMRRIFSALVSDKPSFGYEGLRKDPSGEWD